VKKAQGTRGRSLERNKNRSTKVNEDWNWLEQVRLGLLKGLWRKWKRQISRREENLDF